MTTKYNIGMIGVGRMGSNHARAYVMNPSTDLIAGADTDPELLALFQERFDVEGYTTWDEMFNDKQIDIAAPVLPVSVNADAVVASARAGVKAIFCEKPLTASLSDADRMVEECKSRGIVFAAGLVPRNYPEMWQAREMIESGELGEVQSINIYERLGQGGCHGINMARHFAGDAEAEWVIGWTEGDPHGETEEEFGPIGGYIRFENGVETFVHRKEENPLAGASKIQVICDKAVLYRDDGGMHMLQKSDAGVVEEVKGVFPVRSNERYYDTDGWTDVSFGLHASVQAIVDTLNTGEKLRATTGNDLQKSLEIVIAMRESARRGHTPVKLPMEDRSLTMRPMLRRWTFKVTTMGREAYMQDMAAHRGMPGARRD